MTRLMDAGAVMRRYLPPGGTSWADLFAGIMSDAVGRERVAVLRHELRSGPFRLPVVVDDGEVPRVVDGRHRLVAAHLAGSAVPVAPQPPPQVLDFWNLVVDVRWHEDDHRFDPFAALPLADGSWAEPGRAAHPCTDGSYDLRYGLQPGTDAVLLREALSGFLSRHGWDPAVRHLRPAAADDLLR